MYSRKTMTSLLETKDNIKEILEGPDPSKETFQNGFTDVCPETVAIKRIDLR